MTSNHRTWLSVKGRIISRFGTISACASRLGCSEDGIRKAVEGRCPGIAGKLKATLGYDWNAPTEVAA